MFAFPFLSDSDSDSDSYSSLLFFGLILRRKFMQGALVRQTRGALAFIQPFLLSFLFFSFKGDFTRGKMQLQQCSGIFLSAPYRSVLGVSICKWCISGREMLLMIYLHLALIYANVSLFLCPSTSSTSSRNKNKTKTVTKSYRKKRRRRKVPHGFQAMGLCYLWPRPVLAFQFFMRRARQHREKKEIIMAFFPSLSLKSFLFAFRDFEQTDKTCIVPFRSVF